MDNEKIIHDLALIHTQAKYAEFFKTVPAHSRPFQSDINELVGFYKTAVIMLANHTDEIESAYNGNCGDELFND